MDRESRAAELLASLSARGPRITGEGRGSTRGDSMQGVAFVMSGLDQLSDELLRAKYVEWRGPTQDGACAVPLAIINLMARRIIETESDLPPAGAVIVARAAIAGVLFPVRCGRCRGVGVMPSHKPCHVCDGEGVKPMSNARRAHAGGVTDSIFRRKYADAANRAESLLRRIEGAALSVVADNMWPRNRSV